MSQAALGHGVAEMTTLTNSYYFICGCGLFHLQFFEPNMVIFYRRCGVAMGCFKMSKITLLEIFLLGLEPSQVKLQFQKALQQLYRLETSESQGKDILHWAIFDGPLEVL